MAFIEKNYDDLHCYKMAEILTFNLVIGQKRTKNRLEKQILLEYLTTDELKVHKPLSGFELLTRDGQRTIPVWTFYPYPGIVFHILSLSLFILRIRIPIPPFPKKIIPLYPFSSKSKYMSCLHEFLMKSDRMKRLNADEFWDGTRNKKFHLERVPNHLWLRVFYRSRVSNNKL